MKFTYTRFRYFTKTFEGDALVFEYSWADDLPGWPSWNGERGQT